MRLDAHEMIARLCHAEYLEELLGDLDELRARRTLRQGPRRARFQFWLDVVSVLVFQSRMRRWTGREWVGAGVFAMVILVLLVNPGRERPPTGPYTIRATDAAGVFTLDMLRGRVLAATMDGHQLPMRRVAQHGSNLTLRSADGSADLAIEITPAGGIRWDGRSVKQADRAKQGPIPLEWARAYFTEIDSVSAADGGALWGMPLAGPILFAERRSRALVANVADSAGMLSERAGVWVGTLPEEVGIANTAVDWAGRRWTMVAWPVPSQGYARRQLLLHESFHRIQSQLGLELGNPTNPHLGTRDGRILARLEWRALAEALIRHDGARAQAVTDALIFRARRYALFPSALTEERALELNEGLAEYTGLRLSGLPATARAVKAAQELLRRESAENFARSFAYATGPAYGTLLDAADPTWRDRVRSSEGLHVLLGAAYGVSLRDGTDVAVHAARYDGRRVIEEETRAAERAATERARLLATYVEGPTLSLPVANAFSYTFDPNRVIPLEGHGTVYVSAEVRDEWGLLIVESGGVLMKRPDRLITGVVVPVAREIEGPPTAGDGWRLELAEGWKVQLGDRPGAWVVARSR